MDFTNEINTLESEKLRLEEMLKRNNDRLQLLKEASTEPSSDGYRRFFKLKGYSLLYTGGERLNHERLYLATFVIPSGSVYFINEEGDNIHVYELDTTDLPSLTKETYYWRSFKETYYKKCTKEEYDNALDKIIECFKD